MLPNQSPGVRRTAAIPGSGPGIVAQRVWTLPFPEEPIVQTTLAASSYCAPGWTSAGCSTEPYACGTEPDGTLMTCWKTVCRCVQQDTGGRNWGVFNRGTFRL